MRKILALGLVMLLGGQASAAFVSVTGSGAIVTAGAGKTVDQVLNSLEQNRTEIWGFNEQQLLLDKTLQVDGLTSNTFANRRTIRGDFASHFIFFNRNSAGPLLSTVWTFDQEILGVMSDIGGRLESLSTGLVGLSGVVYPQSSTDTTGLAGGNGTTNYLTSSNSFSNRGLEGSPVILGTDFNAKLTAFNAATNDAYFFSGNKLYLKMDVSQPGDWIRVITRASLLGTPGGPAVPEPTTMALWGLGAAGFGWIARRRKK